VCSDGMAGVVFTMVIILGGIITGVFTATRSRAAAPRRCMPSSFTVLSSTKGNQDFRIAGNSSGNAALRNAGRHAADRKPARCIPGFSPTKNLPTLLADNFFNLIQTKWAFLLILNGLPADRRHVSSTMTPALIMLVPMLIPPGAKIRHRHGSPRT